MPGLDEVESYLSGAGPAPVVVGDAMISDALAYLKKVVAKLGDDNQRKFMAEAISSSVSRCRRSSGHDALA